MPGAAGIGSYYGEQWAPAAMSSLSTLFSYDSPPGTAKYAAALASPSQQVSTTMPELETEGELKTLPAPMTIETAAAARSPGIVKVRSVWAHNLNEEVKLIESLFTSFRFAAVDTEFPGTVHRPSAPAYTLTRKQKYALLKKNVDELHLVQLGLTLFDADGRLPDLGTGGAVHYVWEFNFREFDLRRHAHASESIALLRSKGVDFDMTRQDGVDAAAFGSRLGKWLRAGLGRAGLVTFSGAYDLAYMLKMLYGGGYRLPGDAATFEFVVKTVIGKTLYDVSKMARHCPGDLRGGLECVAGKLDVRRAVGEAHQAGSDSLLTCQMFMRMKERYFDQAALATVAGINLGCLIFTSCEYT
uniref:poly(A)-specific ribonuclease n=1 Tax=Oryza punctata TaxID=4537 RepID=A0A0E0LHK8_ORYPU